MTNFYFFFGQSNSRGNGDNADLHPTLSGAMSNVRMWGGSSFASFQVGTNQSYPTPDGFHGAAPAFLFNEQIRVGGTIYAAMYSVGGTPMHDDATNLTWYPSKAGALLDAAISTINNALAAMWNTHGIREFKIFLIWQQGESDTTTDPEAAAYQASIASLISKVAANISGTAFVSVHKYWIFVKIGTGTSYDPTRRATVNSAFDTVAAIDSTHRFTHDPSGNLLKSDLHHYEASGYKIQGQNMVTGITTSNNL